MSDTMERDKTEMLTAKEKRLEEEEKMKQELLDMKMYEEWYTYKDMKQIIGFINESKDMANITNDGKNARVELINEGTSTQVTPVTNPVQESEIPERNDTSQIIHSYTCNILNSNSDSVTTATTSNDFRNSIYKGKNIDSDNTFSRLRDNSTSRNTYSGSINNRCISLKSKNSLQDCNVTNNSVVKTDTKPECNRKLHIWQIDPLASCISENDVPLKDPRQHVVQQRPSTDDILEELMPRLVICPKVGEESRRRRRHTKFEWGSPIPVGHPQNNSDKKSLLNLNTDQNQMECTGKHYNDRPTNKRKFTSTFPAFDITYHSSDKEGRIIKKKKTRYHENASPVPCSGSTQTREMEPKCTNPANNNVNQVFENMGEKDVQMEYQNNAKDCSTNELYPIRSRTSASPNVRKYIDPSGKKLLGHASNERESETSSEKKNNILTDKEIALELAKDNCTNDINVTSERIEIKPLSMKRLSHRIKNECIVLEKIQLEKQKIIESEKEAARQKEYEEKRKREEFYKKQIEERQRKEKLKEEKEKYREEQSKRWKYVVDMKSQKRISQEERESLQNSSRQNQSRVLETIDKNRGFQDINTSVNRHMEITRSEFANNVNCPICNKYFPSDKIETHAAECEQFETENEYESNLYGFDGKVSPENIHNSEILECGVCSKYKTTNGIDYEDHVNSCLQKQHQQESSNEYSNSDIDNVLNSPIRCYRPISEQNDSHIDYRGQFPSSSRTQVSRNRKRKH